MEVLTTLMFEEKDNLSREETVQLAETFQGKVLVREGTANTAMVKFSSLGDLADYVCELMHRNARRPGKSSGAERAGEEGNDGARQTTG